MASSNVDFCLERAPYTVDRADDEHKKDPTETHDSEIVCIGIVVVFLCTRDARLVEDLSLGEFLAMHLQCLDEIYSANR
jgi:hypothetical protein